MASLPHNFNFTVLQKSDMGLDKTKIKVLAGLCSFFREAPGKDLFPYSYRLLAEFSCLQLQDRAPCFLAGCQLRVIPSFYKPHTFLGLWPLSSIFRASNGGRILLMLQISPLLISLTQLGKGFCFLKTHVITLGPLR